MLVDTHCHFDIIAEKFGLSIELDDIIQFSHEIMRACAKHQVTTCITVGTDAQSSELAVAIAQSCPSVFCSVGLHPSDCTSTWQHEVKKISHLLEKHNPSASRTGPIVAVGEIGLDFYHPGFNRQAQLEACTTQIELALKHNLPVIIHTRSATDETLALLNKYRHETGFRGVVHCFSDTPEIAREVINLGFYIGISGAITYPKNETLRQVVRAVGLDHILLETDAPFLPPQIIRGKPNHPQYIATIAEFLVGILSEQASPESAPEQALKPVTFELVAEKTTRNAHTLFGLQKVF
jgi:TatD DNase family protein